MDDIRSYVEQHRAEHARELAAWIAVPSISATGEGMDRAPNYALNLLRDSGLAVQLVETGGGPLIVGHAEGSGPHVVIYGHYDVQPPGPLSEWDSLPFELTERGGRFYGRGTGDNKGQHLAQLLGLRALRDCRGALPCAVTVLLDGEEELGSPNLESTLRGMDLDGDLVIWSDGPVHESGEPTVCLGVRGIVTFEITVRGADLPLHSGNWGGVAPNPAWELVWLLSTLRSAEGRIGLDWNAPELTDAERSALAALPVDVPATLNSVGLDRMDVPLYKDFSERLA
ncbi:MAG TPA: M20/M25/M40 family metallo-hydrolase, partial [Mycobacteriales bacterium]|nr:M20/M25/M40 family metallo-hydrolase [Mycobacteriales bacterium]